MVKASIRFDRMQPEITLGCIMAKISIVINEASKDVQNVA
jgi:hypothetical protein